MNNTNEVVVVKRRAIKAAAIQFNGKNGKDIVQFVKTYAGEPDHIRNGGSYVTIHFDGSNGRARKDSWVVVDADGSLKVLSPENFELLFSIKA